MGLRSCNLSDPQYGYDLVVAVSQRSVNAALKQFLDNLEAPVVTVCYMYNDKDQLTPVDFETLKAKTNVADPFVIPDNSPVTMDAFKIIGFNFGPRGRTTWLNKSQPTGDNAPWYFSSDVELNSAVVQPTNPNLPKDVKARRDELIGQGHDGAFTIQKLFLDLDTAIMRSLPEIEGIPVGWPIWNLVHTVFLDAYFGELKKLGSPALSYHISVTKPDPSTMKLAAIAQECQAFLAPNGQPTDQQLQGSTLNYVASRTLDKPLVPILFPFNFVDEDQIQNIAGVQVVRRGVFFEFLQDKANEQMQKNLAIATRMSLTHSGETFYIYYGISYGGDYPKFAMVSPIGTPDSDGFTTVLTATHATNTSDDSTQASHFATIRGDYNLAIDGSIAVKDNQIRVRVHATLYVDFTHTEFDVHYTDLEGRNWYDKTRTVVYTLNVTDQGNIRATMGPPQIDDKSQEPDWHAKGIMGGLEELDRARDNIKGNESDLGGRLDQGIANFDTCMQEVINGSNGWIFPGGDAYVFKHVSFSDAQDLTVQITYAAV